MKSNQVEKKQLEAEGVELEGLVSIDEYVIEDDVVEVPGRKKTVPVRNGVKKIPAINAVYKVTRNSKTFEIHRKWYEEGETKNCILIRTDGAGKEFAREIWVNVEVSKFHSGGYDAAAPGYAQQLVTYLPEDIIFISPEG